MKINVSLTCVWGLEDSTHPTVTADLRKVIYDPQDLRGDAADSVGKRAQGISAALWPISRSVEDLHLTTTRMARVVQALGSRTIGDTMPEQPQADSEGRRQDQPRSDVVKRLLVFKAV